MPRPIKRKARPVRVAKGSDDTWKAKKAKRDAANLEKLKSAMTKYDIDGSTALSRPEVRAHCCMHPILVIGSRQIACPSRFLQLRGL